MTVEDKIANWVAEAILDEEHFSTYDPDPQLATVKRWIKEIVRKLKGRVD